MFDNMKQCASMGHTKRNHSLWRLTWCENSQIEISDLIKISFWPKTKLESLTDFIGRIRSNRKWDRFLHQKPYSFGEPKKFTILGCIYTNGTTNLYNGFIYTDYYQYWGLYLFGFNQCEIC